MHLVDTEVLLSYRLHNTLLVMRELVLLMAIVCLAGCSSSKWMESSIDKSDYPITNITQALEGRAGVLVNSSGMPGSSPSLLIRGISSLNASTEPLYIVDGMPYDGPLSMLNPYDIESIQILKNSSETSIYGIRGANGVVVIKTKKGGANKK